MKKTRIFVLLFLFVLVVSGCSRLTEEKETKNETAVQNDTNISSEGKAKNTDKSSEIETSSMSTETGETKVLIAYFTRADNVKQDDNLDVVSSASINTKNDAIIGNMEIMADYIKEVTGGEKFSIKTEKRYSQDYDTTTDQAKKEQNDAARPKLISHVADFDNYDMIFVGYPNWWGTIPMPVYRFLEEYDFAGKTIIPFCSHEGSGLGGGVSDIKSLCPDAVVLEGLEVRGSAVSDSKAEISKWIKNLGIMK